MGRRAIDNIKLLLSYLSDVDATPYWPCCVTAQLASVFCNVGIT
jgi:hypothetical protein